MIFISTIFFNLLQDLEKDKATLLQTPIVSTLLVNSFTNAEIQLLKQNSLITFSALLDHRTIGDRIMILPAIRPDISSIVMNINLESKLREYVEKFTNKHNLLCLSTIQKDKFKKLAKPMIHTDNFNPSIISMHFKRMHREKFDNQAPSIKTRINDGLYFPDIESFQLSFKKLFSLPLILYYKSFFSSNLQELLLAGEN